LKTLEIQAAQKLSAATWRLLIRSLPETEWDRDPWTRGVRKLVGPRGGDHGQQTFDASFIEQLRDAQWLFGQYGKLHKPSELFKDTSENRQLLADSVAYIVSTVGLELESEEWLASRLGINLTPNTEHALKHLRELKGKYVNLETPRTIYQFLARQCAQRREEFERENLIYTESPRPLWCSSRGAFWEDESSVFGEQRGYLQSQYPESLKPFFSSVGVADRAGELDYLRSISEISDAGITSEEIQNRVHNLYRRVWAIFQESKPLLQQPLWSQKWNELITSKSWLGRNGDAVGFFHCDELAWRDNDYLSQLFSGHVPHWMFDDLTDFAIRLGVVGCSSAQPIFSPLGEQVPLDDWTEKLRQAVPDIRGFLTSPKWREQLQESASLDVLPKLEIRLIEEAKVSFSLKGAVIPEAEPRSSYLDASGNTVWLVLKAPESEFPELIGEALQDFFGTPELREFTKDLLSADGSNYSRILARWQKRGLRLATEEEQTDSLSAAQQKPHSDDTGKAEPDTTKAKETSGQKQDSRKAPDGLSEETRTSQDGGSRSAKQEPKSSDDKATSSGKSESRPRQDYYRTYVGKDEPQENAEAIGAKQEHRSILNRAGVNRVLEYERSAGRNPTEMSHTHPGYDVESGNPSGEIERFIEVKSCPGDWDRRGVALTKTQFEKAIELGDKFWLYVVERAEAEDFNIIRIQNPGRRVNQFFYDEGWRVIGE
jgi:hypothetical protein